MRKYFPLLAILSVFGFVSVAAITGVSPRSVGTFYTSQFNFDSATIGGVGGVVKTYIADALDTPRVGQIVFLSAKNLVKHSATLVNYNSIEGVVVGGASTNMQASYVVGDTSTIAALPGKKVLVLERGRAFVLVDGGSGFSPGTQVIPSASGAGRITSRTTAIDTLNRIFGKTVDTAISGKAVLVDVRVR